MKSRRHPRLWRTLFYDSETFSELALSRVGVHVYAAHPTTEINIVTYALDDGPVHAWDLTAGEPIPDDLYDALADTDTEIVAHNAPFDRTVMCELWPQWRPLLTIDRWHCTMAQALAHSLPGGLDKLGRIFSIAEEKRKIEDGRKLVLLFCKPRPKKQKLRRATRLTHPEEWARYLEYAKSDITSMRELYYKMPRWNLIPDERQLWELDQKINERGVFVDQDLARAAIRAIAIDKTKLGARTKELTSGFVASTTQRDLLLKHILAEYGIALPDMQADTLERRIGDENLPDALRELLAIRLMSSTVSTAKYEVFIRACMADGRVRGTLQFCGALRTARWAGRLVQLHNMPRPTIPHEDIVQGIEALKADIADMLTGNVMELCSNAIRGCIIAPPDRELVVADLSNIEGRVGAWLAGEEWKLDAFRAYDNIIGVDAKGKPVREGVDLYKLAYAKSFNVSPDFDTSTVDGNMQRQIGKVQELMLQYQGGVGAYVTGAANYGIDLDDLTTRVLLGSDLPHDIYLEAANMWEWAVDQRRTLSLPRDIFIACDCLKRLWRRAHPATVQHWGDLMEAATSAVRDGGRDYPVGFVRFRRDGSWLRCVLPSGRSLCYPSPEVRDNGTKLTYMGVNQYTRQWTRVSTYGGKLLENIDQAISRDVLGHGMPIAEEAGFEIICTVHDELITETDAGERDHEQLSEIMATVPKWAPGLPLAAAGFTAKRYAKH